VHVVTIPAIEEGSARRRSHPVHRAFNERLVHRRSVQRAHDIDGGSALDLPYGHRVHIDNPDGPVDRN
jgi:hypothetical protein